MTYISTGKQLSEAELMKFKWWYEMYEAKMIEMWELQARFGKKVDKGLIKPMTRMAIWLRVNMLRERGLIPKELDKDV